MLVLVFNQPAVVPAGLYFWFVGTLATLVPVVVVPLIAGAAISRPAALLRTTNLSGQAKRLVARVVTISVVLLELFALATFHSASDFPASPWPAAMAGVSVAGAWVLGRELLLSLRTSRISTFHQRRSQRTDVR